MQRHSHQPPCMHKQNGAGSTALALAEALLLPVACPDQAVQLIGSRKQVLSEMIYLLRMGGCSDSPCVQLTQDKRDLDLGQVQEVLGDVDGYLVQEGRGDVESVLDVVQVAACLQSSFLLSCS